MPVQEWDYELKPTKPGLYWFGFNGDETPYFGELVVVIDHDTLRNLSFVVSQGMPIPVVDIERWIGPIKRPEKTLTHEKYTV
jgi:hypothetical protein